MFDSNLTCHQSNTQNIKINAVTGAILKNHPKSWFERFHLNSPRGKELLEEGGHKGGRDWNCRNYTFHDPQKDVIVLQMVLCGDMEVLAECVYAKDYQEILDREGE